MAGGSLRKKPQPPKSKRSVPNLSSSPSPMASRSPPALVPDHKRIFILVSISLIVCVIVLLSISSNTSSSKLSFSGEEVSAEVYSVEVVNEYSHDPNAFTQGLLYAGNDSLFESTGLHGKSSVRKVDLKTGKVEVLERMDYSFFGEGLTMIGERLYQVTWLTKTGFIYERNNLSKV
ncbi:Glutaminyl-peptide cyclotransferase-like protein, partial [Drosera capensis]